MGCRVSKQGDWKVRIVHEASLHEDNCFVTLTYDAEHIPDDYSVSVRALQLFMKRLRKQLGRPIRYFACGEYGDHGHRPHYHLIIFGWMPQELTPWRKSNSGHVLYRSAEIERAWGQGHCEVGSVTPDSAQYVAGYVIKRRSGVDADAYYTRHNPLTGELVRQASEFILMSSRPGIGAAWFEKYADDAFPDDFVVVDGKKMPVPRYYLQKANELVRLGVKQQRRVRIGSIDPKELETRRMMTKHESGILRANALKRDLETGDD